MSNLPKSVAHGVWRFNGMAMDVLDDGQRVIGQRDAIAALTGAENTEESGGAKTGGIDRFLSRIPGVSSEIHAVPSVVFQRGRQTVHGRPADWFVKVCLAYVTAHHAGTLHPKQIPIAINAAMLLAGFATEGVRALVDEVTGYQQIRPGDAIQTEVERFLRADPCAWDVVWPNDVVALICTLYRYPWNGIGRQPRWVRSIMDKIYRIVLVPTLYREFQAISQSDADDVRKHQHFAPDAREAFKNVHMSTVVALLKSSDTVDDFWERLESHYGRRMRQIDIALPAAE